MTSHGFRKTSSVITFWLLLVILVLGCGGTKVLTYRSLERPVRSYSALYFSAEAHVVEDITTELAQLEESVLKGLDSLGIFPTVRLGKCQIECENALVVEAAVTNIRKVGQSSRFFLGGLPGSAELTVKVAFLDANSGTILGSYLVTSSSGNSGFSGGTKTVLKRVAKKIVELAKQSQ